MLKDIAESLEMYRKDQKHSNEGRVRLKAQKFIDVMSSSAYIFDSFKLGLDNIKELKTKDLSIDEIEKLFFDFHGIKNTMHTYIKDKKEDPFHKNDFIQIWGDVDLAIDMLGRF
jgi:hypothetical protein